MSKFNINRQTIGIGLAIGFCVIGVKVALHNVLSSSSPLAAVVDQAGLIAQDNVQWLSQYNGKLFEDFDIDYHVLTTKGDIADINSYAYTTFRKNHVGSRSRSGRGLLLVVDPQGNHVRLEISGALEGIYTDAFVRYIEERQMVPFFREGRVADGILAATELIYTRAMDAENNKDFVLPKVQ